MAMVCFKNFWNVTVNALIEKSIGALVITLILKTYTYFEHVEYMHSPTPSAKAAITPELFSRSVGHYKLYLCERHKLYKLYSLAVIGTLCECIFVGRVERKNLIRPKFVLNYQDFKFKRFSA